MRSVQVFRCAPECGSSRTGLLRPFASFQQGLVIIATIAAATLLAGCAGWPAEPTADELSHQASTSPVALNPVSGKPAEVQSAEVVARYFPEPEVDIPTPAFGGQKTFTSYPQLMAYVSSLATSNRLLTVLKLGTSQQGLDIPMLVFTTASGTSPEDLQDTGKPTVWVQAQLHGNEPAGGEGALALAWALNGSLAYVLDRLNVIIVPRVNVDGAVGFSRHTADNRDLNRDSLRLDVAESLALHQANIAYAPVVTVDAHEYRAGRPAMQVGQSQRYLEWYDVLIQGPENPNVPARLRSLTQSMFIDNVRADLTAAGMSSSEYYLARTRFSESGEAIDRVDLYAGGSAARIGRNFHGLLNQVSILVESRGIGIGRQSYRRRVYSQLIAMQSIIESAWQNARGLQLTINELTAEVVARGAVIDDDDPLVLSSTHNRPRKHNMPYIDAQSADTVQLAVYWHRFDPVVPRLVRERPFAYVLPPAAAPAVARLRAFGVLVEGFEKPRSLAIQAYRIHDMDRDSNPYQGVIRQRVTAELEEHNLLFPKGSFIVYMAQDKANLAAELLEPECSDSFVTFGILKVDPDGLLPVYRTMQPFSV